MRSFSRLSVLRRADRGVSSRSNCCRLGKAPAPLSKRAWPRAAWFRRRRRAGHSGVELPLDLKQLGLF